MTLDVLGAGFGRTGTYSLKLALEALDFGPCHHMYEVRRDPQQVDWWLAASKGAKLDWDAVFDGYRSQVDWPASYYWRELAAHFTDARVILTDRDPDSWYESISQTILPASERGRFEEPDETNRKASEMIYRIALQGIFEGRLGERDYAISRMMRHREEVIETIPKDRLLVYGVGDGWEPLCRFLGVPVPDIPYPRGNSVAEFIERKPYLKE